MYIVTRLPGASVIRIAVYEQEFTLRKLPVLKYWMLRLSGLIMR